ncbi:MAG: hypothetical protein J4G01_02980 [Dehalococcoidia bacterium]|nr:hypothetical protein [Dehalococcoidia bacterium]
MSEMDRQYLGSLLRVETDESVDGEAGIAVNIKRAQRPMRAMGLRAI